MATPKRKSIIMMAYSDCVWKKYADGGQIILRQRVSGGSTAARSLNSPLFEVYHTRLAHYRRKSRLTRRPFNEERCYFQCAFANEKIFYFIFDLRAVKHPHSRLCLRAAVPSHLNFHRGQYKQFSLPGGRNKIQKLEYNIKY